MQKNTKRRNIISSQKAEIEKRELITLDKGFTRDTTMIGNKIIEGRYDFSATEMKTLIQCSTLLNHSENDDDGDLKRYKIGIKDFCEKIGLNTTNIFFINAKLRELVRKVIEIQSDKGYIGFPIFSMLSIIYEEQMIYFAFNSLAKPYLINLTRYAKIKASTTNSFNSIYSIRFYLWIKNYRKMRERKFGVAELIEKCKLEKKRGYNSWTRLFKYVIAPAIKELNEKSDLYVNFDPKQDIIKTGRKVSHFTLHFGNKATRIADEFTEWIKEKHRKAKSFSVFKGVRVKTHPDLPEIYEITQIRTNKGKYFEAMYGEYALFGKSEKNDFIDELAKHIHRACEFIAENERKEKLPFEEWHNKKIQVEEFKKIYMSWIQPQQPAKQESPTQEPIKPSKYSGKGFNGLLEMKKDLDEKIKNNKPKI